MTTAALWAAVDALTQPRQIRLTRDNGQHDWTQTPSLWTQLTDAIPTGQEQGTGGHSSSYRIPISVDCLDLRTDIHTTTLDALRAIREKPEAADRQRGNAAATYAVTFIRLRGGLWRAVLTIDQWATYARETLETHD